MTKHTKGFTVIELIFFILLAGSTSIIFFVQKNNIEVAARDDARKTAINAIYYNLEKVFYPTNNYYPREITTETLKTIDPEMLIDSNGKKINETGSLYTYQPTDCSDDKCKNYTIKTTLEKEADYVKKSDNK